MPNFSFIVVSNTNLGLAANSVSIGTTTIGTRNTMTVTDDDSIFDDETTNSGQTLDLSSQVLAFDIGIAPAGNVVQSVYQNTITNTTTGETGTAYAIRIYTGTDPNNPGSQLGEYYWAFSIPVDPGDTIVQNSGNFVAQTAYNNLVACFTSGTMIRTNQGEKPINDLKVGDLIETLDHGLQPIRWIGSSIHHATGNLAPIKIAKGTLGNSRDLRVSPQHRMLLSGQYAELLFEQSEVLVTAKSLINDHSIYREEGGMVEYYHILFDTHEIIFAEGSKTESFHPGEEGWIAMDAATRNEILEIFPDLAENNFSKYGPSARMSLKHKEGALLGEYLLN